MKGILRVIRKGCNLSKSVKVIVVNASILSIQEPVILLRMLVKRLVSVHLLGVLRGMGLVEVGRNMLGGHQ